MTESKSIRRVRFSEKVTVVDIQRVDRTPEDNDNTTNCIDTIDDQRLEFGREDNIDRSHTKAIFGNTSICFSSYKFQPIKNPSTIPTMLFNSSPVSIIDIPSPSSTSSSKSYKSFTSSADHRWREVETNSSEVSVIAPIRRPSIEDILENALAVLESPHAAVDEHSSRKNHLRDESELIIECKRRRTPLQHYVDKRWYLQMLHPATNKLRN